MVATPFVPERDLMLSGPKIGIVGAGAVGCYLGGRLAAAGAQVSFFGRPRMADEVLRHGLCTIDMGGNQSRIGKAELSFASDPAILRELPVLLGCVKCAQTAEVARQIDAFVRADALVVSCQNGIGNSERWRDALPGRRVLSGIVGFNVRAMGDGVFRQATSGQLLIEGNDGVGALAQLVERCKQAGIAVRCAPSIRGEQWAKLIMNLNNAVSALSDLPLRDLLASRDYRSVIADLMTEALVVLERAGIRPARLGTVAVKWFPPVLRLPNRLFWLLARAQLQIDPHARSSMWEDLRLGRPTEIEYLNGEIVRLARECGVAAPMNARIVELVHRVEASTARAPGCSAEALRRALSDGSPAI